ncbi:MAG: 30S ribosomal protein S6 [Tissierellia bacterium]|nr:30S ribosomal protein S6 [Tissierellia bacterium]
MRKYEGVLVFKPELTDEVRNISFDKIKAIIEKDGKITDVDEWGKRKLAYEINYIKEGYYVIVKFEANADVVTEVERRCKLEDAIIRYMVVREDA